MIIGLHPWTCFSPQLIVTYHNLFLLMIIFICQLFRHSNYMSFLPVTLSLCIHLLCQCYFVNSYNTEFTLWNIKMYLFLWFLNTNTVQLVKICLHGSQCWYHCCWWPGNARSQGISSNDINQLIPEYSGFSTRGVTVIAEWGICIFSVGVEVHLHIQCGGWLVPGMDWK